MTAKRRSIVGWTLLLLLPIAYLIGSELYYARSISPRGIVTVHDYVDRFGQPPRVQIVEQRGRSFYEFTGQLPPAYVLAIPSAPPVYVFDEQGRFVSWCRDPGDTPEYRRLWPLKGEDDVDVEFVRENLGL